MTLTWNGFIQVAILIVLWGLVKMISNPVSFFNQARLQLFLNKVIYKIFSNKAHVVSCIEDFKGPSFDPAIHSSLVLFEYDRTDEVADVHDAIKNQGATLIKIERQLWSNGNYKSVALLAYPIEDEE